MPYAFMVTSEEYYASIARARIYSWLGENFGEYGSPLWDMRERTVIKFNVYFNEAPDAMAFKLKFA